MPRIVQTSADLVDALPAYILSDEVESVAGDVIADTDAFRSLDEIRIGYALRTDSPIGDDEEVDQIVGTVKSSALWACLSDYDVVIWVKQPYWKLYDATVRRAVVTHALCHVFVTEEGKVKRLGHDVEEFTRVAAQFGAWSAKLAQFERGLYRPATRMVPQTTANEAAGAEVTVDDDGVPTIHIDQEPAPPKVDSGKVVELANHARSARGRTGAPVVTP